MGGRARLMRWSTSDPYHYPIHTLTAGFVRPDDDTDDAFGRFVSINNEES
mgnify:FL=1